MLKAVEPFCSDSLKPTKPLTVPSKLTCLGAHVVHSEDELLQLANDAAMRVNARAGRKVIFSLPLKRMRLKVTEYNCAEFTILRWNRGGLFDEHHENVRA
jgi:hypothetical protein